MIMTAFIAASIDIINPVMTSNDIDSDFFVWYNIVKTYESGWTLES